MYADGSALVYADFKLRSILGSGKMSRHEPIVPSLARTLAQVCLGPMVKLHRANGVGLFILSEDARPTAAAV